MKIKKLIKLLECVEGDYNGNLPQDMYNLGSYTRADDSRMGIDDMDFVHTGFLLLLILSRLYYLSS